MGANEKGLCSGRLGYIVSACKNKPVTEATAKTPFQPEESYRHSSGNAKEGLEHLMLVFKGRKLEIKI